MLEDFEGVKISLAKWMTYWGLGERSLKYKLKSTFNFHTKNDALLHTATHTIHRRHLSSSFHSVVLHTKLYNDMTCHGSQI